jgi:hypothetical protein
MNSVNIKIHISFKWLKRLVEVIMPAIPFPSIQFQSVIFSLALILIIFFGTRNLITSGVALTVFFLGLIADIVQIVVFLFGMITNLTGFQ